ncbi:MAG TPA: hypothetical protein ENI29_12815 [bacterium]|nr:hypothetical protein [bacterium]
MSYNKKLSLILSDLRALFELDEISVVDFQSFLNKLKTKEVKDYLVGLSKGSKPEQVLRETFFTMNAELAKFLFKNIFPEVSQEGSFIDYLIKEEREEIILEIKPLYTAIFKKEKSGAKLVKIKKNKLNPKAHEAQISKYLHEKRDYVVLTNLEEWYFFSKSALLEKTINPFGHTHLLDLLENFKQVDDFWQLLDNQEDIALKEPLDHNFFKSLKSWVSQLSRIKFNIEESKKTDLIINLINKFIFIHSLDSFFVISKNYIEEEWSNIERKWTAKNKLRFLRRFLEDINEYFYIIYDTELFIIAEEDKTILDFIDKDDQNIELLYQQLRIVLGIDYDTSTLIWIPGIIQYNLRRIDEDILGKSYETFLAEIRKEQGIYYTPNYITNFIVSNTVNTFFTNLISLFETSLRNKEYDKCKKLLNELFSFKVIDPACGSGSFLIKALKNIWQNYTILNELIEEKYRRYSSFGGTIQRVEEIENEFKEILTLKNTLNFNNKKKLISKIIIRHIHGVDLDKNAIEVAKLNIWLEAIKLAPKEFRSDRITKEINHILPDLEMNLCNGDSLVGLPDEEVIQYLLNIHKRNLEELFKLRNNYINEPAKIEYVKQIVNTKNRIREDLNNNFKEYLTKVNIDIQFLNLTLPFHWALDFWYVYFMDATKKFSPEFTGFNSVIGNPPYFTIRGKGTGSLVQTYSYSYLQNVPNWKSHFRSQSDIYYYFIIKSINLLKKGSNFGFIIESYWLENDYADKLKKEIIESCSLKILINFGRVKKIFEDADNDTCILLFEKIIEKENRMKYVYCKKNFSVGTPQLNNRTLIAHIIQNISKEAFSDEYIDIFWVEQNSLKTTKWVLSKLTEMITKIEDYKALLGSLCEIGQGMVPGRKKEFKISSQEDIGAGGGYWTSKDDKFFDVVNIKSNTAYRIESLFLRPLITNSGIRKFFIVPSKDYLIYTVPFQDGREDINNYPGILAYLKDNKSELKSRYDYSENPTEQKYPWYGYQRIQNIELFETSKIKILCPYRAEENRFALDNTGYFGTTDMYAIVPKSNSKIDLYYLIGILNSKLLTFWYKEAGKSKGLILEFFATPLSKMPIVLDGIDQGTVSKLVLKIVELKKINYRFGQIWFEVSQNYRNGTITLEKLLFEDKAKIQNDEFEKLWISKINQIPDISKKFKKFKIVIKGKVGLQIYGIEGFEEIRLLDLETTNQEYRDIIYLEIRQLLQSRKKINNLKDLLSKSEISIIKPNIWEKTHNLIKYARKQFSKEYDNFLPDIIRVDLIVQALEINLDILIFQLYDLTQSEVTIILEVLGVLNSTKDRIIQNIGS